MKSGNLNFLEPSGPLQACNGADDDYCFDRLRAMTLVTMYWLVLVELEASMHAPLPELWEWGQYLCTSMLEFSLHMEWLLLMLSMRHRNHVPRYMNQVFLWIRKRIYCVKQFFHFVYLLLFGLSVLSLILLLFFFHHIHFLCF